VHRGTTLEQRALSAMVYLRIDRPDHVSFFFNLKKKKWLVAVD
jgi:hypothetical protein